MKKGLLLASVSYLCLPMAALADIEPDNLLNLSLKELTEMEVTSVSKKSEKAIKAAAAVHVITQQEIKRSGATSIPEMLRLAPGVHVAKAGSGKWAVGVRGFTDEFSNKLLVLMDGRTIYTPLFSGVYWDMQDIPADNIDRIEVIRGPGATLWGSNAVNGVINIITKSAADTSGSYVSALYGTRNKNSVTVRQGGEIDEVNYRIYANRLNREQTVFPNGNDAKDKSYTTQAGFRTDTDLSENSTLTTQGRFFNGRNDISLLLPDTTSPFFTLDRDDEEIQGGHMLGKWTKDLKENGEISIQAYYDYLARNNSIYQWSQHTIDIDMQHLFQASENHEIIWGGGYRSVLDDFEGSFYIDFSPDSQIFGQYNLFVQDAITLTDALQLTVGSKFEYNEFTGFEYQPSARIGWDISETQFAWASASRAVRATARSIIGLSLKGIPTFAGGAVRHTSLTGFENADSEKLIAYEAGYRVQPSEQVTLDFSVFYNIYDELINLQTNSLTLETGYGRPARFVIPLQFVNTGDAKSYGGEMSAMWEVANDWRLNANYSLLKLDISGTSLINNEGKAPTQQFSMHSYYSINDEITFDTHAYWVDRLHPSTTVTIPEYLRLDARLGWHVNEGVELEFVGQNLLDNQHPEFSTFTYNRTVEVPRVFYAGIKLHF